MFANTPDKYLYSRDLTPPYGKLAVMRLLTLVVVVLVTVPHTLMAQTPDTVGTRAQGMAGAFVAVVDDASAVYWNPGALAAGSYFSLVLDRSEGRTAVDEPKAGSRSGFLMALAAPALGLSYYRLRMSSLTPPEIATDATGLGRNLIRPGDVRLDVLVTHHAGATLVQSITDAISVGATLKVVRGTAARGLVSDARRGDLLADVSGLEDEGTNRFDADVGVLAAARGLRAGLTIRNATAPEFRTAAGGTALTLRRQVRAGVAAVTPPGWTLAADFDLTSNDGPTGRRRDVAVGAEGRLNRRTFLRGGVRFNTLDDEGRSPSVSVGASYAVKASILVDAQFTGGSDRSIRGWGVAGRFVY